MVFMVNRCIIEGLDPRLTELLNYSRLTMLMLMLMRCTYCRIARGSMTEVRQVSCRSMH